MSNPIAVAFVAYLFVGFIIALFIAARGMKFRQPPSNGMLWEKKDLELIENLLILLLLRQSADYQLVSKIANIKLKTLYDRFPKKLVKGGQ